MNAGSVKISTSTNAIVDNATFTLMSVTEASRTVTVEPKPTASTDNKLKSLSISSAKLSPDFSSSVTEYSASVDFTVKKLAVSAVASDSKAKVSVSGTDLNLGENRITVTVTAESGAKRNYVLKITRLKSELADVTAEVNGWICSFGYDPETLTPPQGFESASGSYNGKNVLTYRDAAGVYTLVWLKPVSPVQSVPGSSAAPAGSSTTAPAGSAASASALAPVGSSSAAPGETSPSQTSEAPSQNEAPAEGWYLMEKDGFYPYADLANGSLRYVPLPLPAGVDPGESAGKTALELDGKTIDAYRDGYCLENGLYLIYARRSDGKEDLFFYNENSGVFYDRIPPQTVTVTVTVTAAPASTGEATEAAAAPKNDHADRNLFRIIAAAMTLIAIALTVALIVSSRRHAARVEELERRAQSRTHRRASREIPEHFNQRADSGKIPDNGDSASEGIGDVFSDDDRD